MRRALLSTVLATAALFAVACSDEHSPLPTQPPPVAHWAPPPGCPTELQVFVMIASLFTPKDFLASARIYYLTSIKGEISRGNITGARQVASIFIDFILKSYDADKLIGHKSVPTQVKVVELINAVLCWVGLDRLPSDFTLGGGAVTIRVIGSRGGDLRANDGLAGVRVPAGAVSGDHVFIATRRDDLARLNQCLNTSFTQYPLCYDFSVVPPVIEFTTNVTVAVCQLEPPPLEPVLSRLRLAHPGSDGIQTLAKVAAPSFTPPLDCTNAALALGSRSREESRWFAVGWTALKRLGSLAVNLITPKPLYAGHVALGGLTISFSPFIAVDPGGGGY